MIRLAVVTDIPVLREIERKAGQPFADIDMDLVAEDEPPSAAALRVFIDDERAWVWTDPAGCAVGYLVVSVVDGCAHIEQVSVDPTHRGQRIGRRLIDHVFAWATANELAAVTMTTFTEVPWNGPYYESMGFRYVPTSEETPGLRAVRSAEAEHGLDHWPRACMRAERRAWCFY